MKKVILLTTVLFVVTACQETSDSVQRRQQEQMSMQAVQTIGMPAIINFQEKRTLKQILEMRDTSISTVTYTQDMNGKLHKVCDSIGYGIPYSTQFTNPMREGMGHVVLPQADPNGLFSPASADATWVTCLNPETKQTGVIMVEPHIIVSPWPLEVK